MKFRALLSALLVAVGLVSVTGCKGGCKKATPAKKAEAPAYEEAFNNWKEAKKAKEVKKFGIAKTKEQKKTFKNVEEISLAGAVLKVKIGDGKFVLVTMTRDKDEWKVTNVGSVQKEAVKEDAEEDEDEGEKPVKKAGKKPVKKAVKEDADDDDDEK